MPSGPDPTIHNISDTALWVAAYRALENERSDAAFRDPFAKQLAGERGALIASEMPSQQALNFWMTVRTAAFDRLIEDAIGRGVDTIINLGAGLDARPYRMQSLPPSLRWIEVDFPKLIDYKTRILDQVKPNCELQRIGLDLSDAPARRELFHKLGEATKKALIITEGVISYLTNEEASAFAAELLAVPSFRYWILDYKQGGIRQSQERKLAQKLKRTPLKFEAKDMLGFFTQRGWRIAEDRKIMDEAERIGRAFPMFFPWSILLKLFPKTIRRKGNATYGYVMRERDR